MPCVLRRPLPLRIGPLGAGHCGEERYRGELAHGLREGDGLHAVLLLQPPHRVPETEEVRGGQSERCEPWPVGGHRPGAAPGAVPPLPRRQRHVSAHWRQRREGCGMLPLVQQLLPVGGRPRDREPQRCRRRRGVLPRLLLRAVLRSERVHGVHVPAKREAGVLVGIGSGDRLVSLGPWPTMLFVSVVWSRWRLERRGSFKGASKPNC
mmetsp:Transcript_78957/g.221318  ORF Transcript_78957/g.221318 Transcript_78957/m.221318 type:complete len:208 (+) Transcript_78957:175-798(+)